MLLKYKHADAGYGIFTHDLLFVILACPESLFVSGKIPDKRE